MEFDQAVQRLEREQSKLHGRTRSNHVSAKAKREADYRKRQQQLMKEQRERELAKNDYARDVWRKCERSLGVQELAHGGLHLRATSIHGDGDKIALPPSVLERLTQTMESDGSSSPWMFRIGIVNPTYTFPASLAMRNLKIPVEDAVADESDEDDDGKKEQTEYLEELSHKYISYSHATVVEFTQDEGHVGLPVSIAAALLNPQRRRVEADVVPSRRTYDPSQAEDSAMDVDSERTPGHLAWGCFDVPDVPLEISLVKLPKGTGCTLIPTMDAIRNGFHLLKDVKLVLEQSLVRSRATLSVGDTVHAWYRGQKYDLTVASVTPSHWNSISCVNTDVVVDIGVNNEAEQNNAFVPPLETTLSQPSGYSLANNSANALTTALIESKVPTNEEGGSIPTSRFESTVSPLPILDLRPEPPADQIESICTVQIRTDQSSGRRRFDVNVATVRDLFSFASSLTNIKTFQLVTRFPRRVLTVQDAILSAAGIQPGQELFLLEQL